jgi:hypothetical protein
MTGGRPNIADRPPQKNLKTRLFDSDHRKSVGTMLQSRVAWTTHFPQPGEQKLTVVPKVG